MAPARKDRRQADALPHSPLIVSVQVLPSSQLGRRTFIPPAVLQHEGVLRVIRRDVDVLLLRPVARLIRTKKN